MDGLECSEININEIDKELFRIEAEYYEKVYRYVEEKLNTFDRIGQIKKEIVCGPFGSNLLDSEYKNNGVLVVRPFNLVNCKIENDRLVYISNETVKTNGLKLFGKGVTLFSRVGDIKIGYANKSNYTISPNIIAVNFEDEAISKYCAIFFNTKYGKIQIQRQLKIAAQPTISTGIIQNLKMPFFEKLSPIIIKCIIKSESAEKEANVLVKKAEYVLSNELSFNMDPNQSISVKMFSDSYKMTNRLDAEYYQSKYAVLFKELSKFNCKSLGGYNGLVDIRKSIEPGSEAYQEDGVPFVRVGDMSEFEITPPSIHLPKDYVDNIEDLYPKKDTILLSKDGSVGIAYKVNKTMPIVTSGAILHLTVKNIDEILPDYLTLILNSQIVKLQAERDSNGAIIQHWKPLEIENVVIPILDMDIQKGIASKVQESFALRTKSKQLLEYAKQAVEMAIEQGEDIAIGWLNEKVKYNGDK